MGKDLDINAPVQVDWSDAEQKTLNIMARVYDMSVSDYVRGKVFRLSDLGERLETLRAEKLLEVVLKPPPECNGSGDCEWCRDFDDITQPCPYAEESENE